MKNKLLVKNIVIVIIGILSCISLVVYAIGLEIGSKYVVEHHFVIFPIMALIFEFILFIDLLKK